MSRCELVIFDCDGVLVDSERITNQVFADMLNEFGLQLTLSDMFAQFVGHSMEQCLQMVSTLLGRSPPETFVADYRARSTAALSAHLLPVSGIVPVLDMLDQRGLAYCVASNGDHAKMNTTLGITHLLSRFEGRKYSAVDVINGKPAPDVFLLAARDQRVAPASCIVIEDTPTGVTAGVAAGMTVYGYAAMTPASQLLQAGAHGVFDDMAHFPDLLARH